MAFHWHSGLSTRLAQLARDSGASESMVVNASLAVLLHRLGAGTDIPIGAAIAGRTDVATDELIGSFVNTLVLRVDLDGQPTFREVLGQVRSRSLDAYDHQDLPFEVLVDALQPTRSMAHHPLTQVLVAWQNFPDVILGLSGLIEEIVPTATRMARMDLAFTVTERYTSAGATAGIDGVVEYNTDIFDQTTIETLVERWQRLLEQVVADPDRPVGRLDVLCPGERVRILEQFNDTGADPTPVTVPQVFAAQAAASPDATAVTYGDGSVSYAALDAASSRLARLLIGRRRPGNVGGVDAAPVDRHDRGDSGRTQGRWGLPAGGPGLSARADRFHGR